MLSTSEERTNRRLSRLTLNASSLKTERRKLGRILSYAQLAENFYTRQF